MKYKQNLEVRAHILTEKPTLPCAGELKINEGRGENHNNGNLAFLQLEKHTFPMPPHPVDLNCLSGSPA